MKPRSELTAREADELITSLTQRLGDTTVPSLPQVAIKIIDLVGNPDSTIKQFGEVISGDQALTGRLLRMANSAAFAQRKSVSNVERAMVLLGLERLKALALGFHLSKAASTDDSAVGFRSMWTQSLFRGCIAMKIAEKINKQCSGEAFVVGFMSDAGVPSMPGLVGEDYPGDQAAASHPTKLHAHERKTYQCTHVDVIMALCRIWKLPERLAKPISLHHTRPSACNPKDDMSLLGCLAYFAGNLPLSSDGKVDQVTTSARDAERLFQINTDDLQTLLKEAGR
ncbi:MAG: HDOD domain-containing protein, partial [Planctomycetota bacterium]